MFGNRIKYKIAFNRNIITFAKLSLYIVINAFM